jgi:hypothetical protein
MKLEDAVRRGQQARQVLDADVYKEAWRAYEQRILEELANADRSDDQAKALRNLLISSRKARSHLERIMNDGTHAAHELEIIERQSRFKGMFRAK